MEFTVCNPECEMERPCDWIAMDPDFCLLRTSQEKPFAEFRKFLANQKQRDYPSVPRPRTARENGQACGPAQVGAVPAVPEDQPPSVAGNGDGGSPAPTSTAPAVAR